VRAGRVREGDRVELIEAPDGAGISAPW
jgi:hypothetical protein